jgi:hypothetical protein
LFLDLNQAPTENLEKTDIKGMDVAGINDLIGTCRRVVVYALLTGLWAQVYASF